MMGDFFDIPFKIGKFLLIVLVIVVPLVIFGYSIGHCQVPAGTSGDTLCKAELDTPAIAKFQKLLCQYGHNLKVLEGTAFATVAGIKKKTFVVVLKCVDPAGNVYAVGINYVKDDMISIEKKPTGERSIEN